MKEAYDILKSRNVSRLCHFTRFVSLKHILCSEDGIKARAFVGGLSLRATDNYRYDGELDYVCCSVEYPNTWYLDKIRDDDPIFKEWAVLSIDLEVLLNRQVKFCPCNAAFQRGRFVEGESSKMSSLFDNPSLKGLYRSQTFLECCPTDSQSEVLVYKNIPLNYINGIILASEEIANQLLVSFDSLGISRENIPQIIISRQMFEKGTWREYADRGERIEEIIYGGM